MEKECSDDSIYITTGITSISPGFMTLATTILLVLSGIYKNQDIK